MNSLRSSIFQILIKVRLIDHCISLSASILTIVEINAQISAHIFIQI